jgi:hypothetical protein
MTGPAERSHWQLPSRRRWWPLAIVLAIGVAIWWDQRVDARLIRDRNEALDAAEVAQIRESKAHASWLASVRRVDVLEQRVQKDSTAAAQWMATARGAAAHIERLMVSRDQLRDSLAVHPPATAHDSIVAGDRTIAVLEQENAALHNEHDALIQAFGAAQLALSAARQQVQIFRAAADSAIATLEANGRVAQQLREQLARSEPPCTSGIPFVKCPSRKKAVVAGILIDEGLRAILRSLTKA